MKIWQNDKHGVKVETYGKGYLMTFKSGSEPLKLATMKKAWKEYKFQLALRVRR